MTADFNAHDIAMINRFIGELNAITGDALTVKNKFYEAVDKLWQMYFSEEACFTEILCLFVTIHR